MKLTKKQIKAVYEYLISIQQPTTAKQFKKDWSKKKLSNELLTASDASKIFRVPKQMIREQTETNENLKVILKGTLIIEGLEIKECTIYINKEFGLFKYHITTPYILGDYYVSDDYYKCSFITSDEIYNVNLYYVNPYGNRLTGTGALTVEPKEVPSWKKANPKVDRLDCMIDEFHQHETTYLKDNLKQNIRDLTEPKNSHFKTDVKNSCINLINKFYRKGYGKRFTQETMIKILSETTPTYHEEDEPGKGKTIQREVIND